MLVGFLNSIPFEVSGSKVRTFSDYNQSGSSRWATHEIIGEKPKLEFIGPGIDKISFKMLLKAELGVNPRSELNKLIKLRDNGTPIPLIIGFMPIGKNLWVVDSVNASVKHWGSYGSMRTIEVDVTLTEYEGGAMDWAQLLT